MITQEESARILYGGFAPRDLPRYTLARAARLVDVSPTTLRSWLRGRPYLRGGNVVHSAPLIKVDSDLLSFSHLVQVHILRSLRREEHVAPENGHRGRREKARDHSPASQREATQCTRGGSAR